MKTRITTLAAIVIMAIGGIEQAQAQYYWDANGAGSGWGGTGVWNFVDLTWRNGHPNNPLVAWVDGNNVKLWAGGSPCALTLQTNIVVASLYGEVPYTIDGPFSLTVGYAEGVGPGTINCPVIMKGGNIQFRDTVTINGNISDDGSNRQLIHYFTTLTLNGSNSFGGGVSVKIGKLVIGHDQALGPGATLDLSNQADPTIEAGGGARTIRNTLLGQGWSTRLIVSGTNNLTFTATQELHGAFNEVYPLGPRFKVVETNTVLTFGGLVHNAIQTSGMGKEGPGTLAVNGPYYSKLVTTVAEGALLLNGTTTAPNNNSGYTVMAGATLGGTGTINLAVSGSTCTVQQAGALAPGATAGASVGTLTVNGKVALAENAIYKWEFKDGAGDLVDVNGTLWLPAVATVIVSRISGNLPATPTLFTANTLAGPGATDVSGWVVQGLRGCTAKVQGTDVILESTLSGTVMWIR